ncbi:hypothetical protein FNF28_02856 [Cafeteria roenbergensis]|uniref:Uncharacterized protein n=1 Tax=Cafeteria roenbergensis TaxID=33653 RepID=A0A5A8DRJ4_CAFRO|nr:hypothetical protein FNF28_02856 [Cafeteria roenbergensis]
MDGPGMETDAGLAEALTDNVIVTPGDVICRSAGFVRGHGTFVREAMLVASVAGVVHRVNRVVSVRPVGSRYVGEVGDVVVGRVTEVAAKRWRVDVRGRQDAVLLLSGLHMGEGTQRRMTAEDQLGMRKHLQEGDLVCADVHTFFSDGGMSLHARSAQYGKLQNGCAVSVPPFLIQRLAAHFVTLPCGVDIVVGMNGVIWVAESVSDEELEAAAAAEEAAARAGSSSSSSSSSFAATHRSRGLSSAAKASLRRRVAAEREVTADARRRVARVRACIAALGWALLAVTPAHIMALYSSAEAAGTPLVSLSDPAVMAELVRGLGEEEEEDDDEDESGAAAAAGADAEFDSASVPAPVVKVAAAL